MTGAAPDARLGLYGAPNSPFSLRVSLAARAKGVQLNALPIPAGGLRSSEFLAINPAAKIPVLFTEGHLAICESAVILEYLEDRFPQPSLLPFGADDRAFMRTIVAMTDRYFMAPVIRLFPQLNRSMRDDTVCRGEIARWRAGMGYLSQLLARPFAPVEAEVSMVECVLAPSFHLGTRIAALLELEADPIFEFPVLEDFYSRMSRKPFIFDALKDMTLNQDKKDSLSGLKSIHAFHTIFSV